MCNIHENPSRQSQGLFRCFGNLWVPSTVNGIIHWQDIWGCRNEYILCTGLQALLTGRYICNICRTTTWSCAINCMQWRPYWLWSSLAINQLASIICTLHYSCNTRAQQAYSTNAHVPCVHIKYKIYMYVCVKCIIYSNIMCLYVSTTIRCSQLKSTDVNDEGTSTRIASYIQHIKHPISAYKNILYKHIKHPI